MKLLTQASPAKDWWPMCAKCGKVVDEVIMLYNDGVVSRYEVRCHGDNDFDIVGIWAVFELAQKKERLPDAFTS